MAVRLAQANLPKRLLNFLYFAEAVVAGRQMERRGLLHLHTHFASTVALLVARVFPVTFSATIHGPDEFSDVAGFYIAEKVARARFICGISRYALSQLMKASEEQYWSKLEVCALGVDPSVFLPAPASRGAPTGSSCCAWDGWRRRKRSTYCWQRWTSWCARDGARYIFDWSETGPERAALERTIAERGLQNNVTLEGACNQSRVLEFYRQADLFVLASFAEGVPVVLMEAMAMEIPCVSTWMTGIPELIRHEVDGWLIPPADEEQLAAAIALLVDDPELRRKIGKSARARVEEKYNLALNTARLGEIYRRRLSIADK